MKYVIAAPRYDENSGGTMFLHFLADALNSLGETAEVWPMPSIYPQGLRKRLRRLLAPPRFVTSPELDTPVFHGRRAPPGAVVVYPELLRGNPLKSDHIVRWLLYKPGVMHPYEFTENEMFFHCGEFFDMPELTGGAPELSMWRRNRIYRNENRLGREGVCYIVRKGYSKPQLPETEDPSAIRIDGLSHAEINEIFNRCETFISYDEATTYSQFAAICGCLSIVVPGFYLSHDAWVASHPLGRYGISYGFDHIDHARATQGKVIEMMEAKERESLESVRNFIHLTHERFS